MPHSGQNTLTYVFSKFHLKICFYKSSGSHDDAYTTENYVLLASVCAIHLICVLHFTVLSQVS